MLSVKNFAFLATLASFTGCGLIKSNFNGHRGPDEFDVIPLAPLSVPKDYSKKLLGNKKQKLNDISEHENNAPTLSAAEILVSQKKSIKPQITEETTVKNRLLSKPSESEFLGGNTEHRSGTYSGVRERSNRIDEPKTDPDEFRKQSNVTYQHNADDKLAPKVKETNFKNASRTNATKTKDTKEELHALNAVERDASVSDFRKTQIDFDIEAPCIDVKSSGEKEQWKKAEASTLTNALLHAAKAKTQQAFLTSDEIEKLQEELAEEEFRFEEEFFRETKENAIKTTTPSFTKLHQKKKSKNDNDHNKHPVKWVNVSEQQIKKSKTKIRQIENPIKVNFLKNETTDDPQNADLNSPPVIHILPEDPPSDHEKFVETWTQKIGNEYKKNEYKNVRSQNTTKTQLTRQNSAKIPAATCANITPARVTPARVASARITPARVTPARVTPARVTPAKKTHKVTARNVRTRYIKKHRKHSVRKRPKKKQIIRRKQINAPVTQSLRKNCANIH
jgi:hypothetical protein